MRVALCFWGLCRSTDITYESIKRYIFDSLENAGIDYDIYLHTYTLYRPYTNLRSNETNVQLKNTLWKLLNPLNYSIEHQDKVDRGLSFEKYRTQGNPWGDTYDYSTLDNHIRSLWSLKQVTNLWKISEKVYTKIIYLRPDVLFKTPLNIEWIKSPLKQTILIPEFHNVYDCNDRFAIGEPEAMLVYGERFNAAYEYSKKKKLHSEGFLADRIKDRGYNFRKIPFVFQRIRANGLVSEADANL